ncbi:MAG: trypsin-like peptidase domain-containing protein, partial [Mobilitalea sp.]
GNGVADALAGSAYAASKRAPIVVVDKIFNNNTASYLNSKNILINQHNVLGGEAVMPSTIVQKYSNHTSDSSSISKDLIYKASEIAKMVSPTVVHIEVRDFNGIPLANGSGFIIGSTGKIATNYHLIKGAYSAKVKTYDGKVYNVSKVLAYDSKQDLAILKIDATGIQTVTLGDSDKIATGDKIYTIGNPEGMDNTMSDGIIGTKSKVVDGISYIQISAPISSGTSGGVLVNEQAEVIGMTTKNVTDGQNLYFSTPINLLKAISTQDINLTLAQLPRDSAPTLELTQITDEEFADPLHFLNSEGNLKNVKNPYNVMEIAGKSVRFIWKVNNYQNSSSKISINGKINSRDYGNWMNLLNTNHRGEVMLYFAKLNSEIATNYPGVSFSGSVLYQDNCTVLPSTSFPYDVSYSGNGSWFVSYPIVTFYDLYTLGKSDAKVVISD